jgi:hypothetical protein
MAAKVYSHVLARKGRLREVEPDAVCWLAISHGVTHRAGITHKFNAVDFLSC